MLSVCVSLSVCSLFPFVSAILFVCFCLLLFVSFLFVFSFFFYLCFKFIFLPLCFVCLSVFVCLFVFFLFVSESVCLSFCLSTYLVLSVSVSPVHTVAITPVPSAVCFEVIEKRSHQPHRPAICDHNPGVSLGGAFLGASLSSRN